MTPTEQRASTSNAVLNERIGVIHGDILELKDLVSKELDRAQKYQTEYIANHAIVVNRVESAHIRLDEQNKRMDALEQSIEKLKESVADIGKSIVPLIFAYKIMAWMAAVLGLSVISLIWAIVTHNVLLVVP